MVMPFIALYIGTFGDYSSAYIQQWSGWTFAITFVAAFLISPVWGRIGDLYGRKRILLICAIGMAVSLFLMGHVTNVWQLLFLRLFMGIFTGFIPMSQAFISTQTPKERAGRVLGTLQTGNITGTLIGPLIGGLLADTIGYASTFQFTAVTLFICAAFVMATKEFKLSGKPGAKTSYSRREVIAHIVGNPVLLTVLLISALIQIAHFSVQPILSLYVGEIHGPENLALFAGIAFSAAGVGNLFMSRRWGQLGDRNGHLKLLLILLVAAGLVYIPGAYVTAYWQLLIIRFLLGLAIGGIIPIRMAYIRTEAPIAMQGEVIGYSTSLRFLGNVIGPVMGGLVAGQYGISAVFITTGLLLLCAAGFLYLSILKHPEALREGY